MIQQKLLSHCRSYIAEILNGFENRKVEILLALESESKSSAGDKHETGRAMIQLEREKLGEQIKKFELHQKHLIHLENHINSEHVKLGSVVTTNQSNYYISFPVRECIVKSKTYYCISAQSPIGKLLLGKKVGDQIIFNNITSLILEVF